MESNYLAMVVATVASVVWSILYYMALSKVIKMPDGGSRPAVWKVLVELLRNFAFVFILAHVFSKLGVTHIADGLRHGFWLWLGFPVILFAGISIWEDMSWKISLSHMGDWLVKILLIASLLISLN